MNTVSLELLNNARVLNGKKPLKAWKESKAKLADALERECENAHGSNITPEQVEAAGLMTDAPVTVEQRVPHNGHKIEFKSSSGKTVAKPHVVKASDKDVITLVEIAKEMKLNPKVARAKLRRIKLPADIMIGKHTYKRAAREIVVAALKTDHRKK